ncbi:MAG: beta-galactosidase, partial [Devosia sp.]
VVKPYFNRSYKHFSSHQHTPDDPDAAPLGPAVTEYKGIAYIAYPIFEMYHAMGQPLYKYVVRDLIQRLMPDEVLRTDMASSGRATLVQQAQRKRHVLHLLHATPQVRGQAVPAGSGKTRVMEMIEDIQPIGPVTASVRLPKEPSRVYEALTGQDVEWQTTPDGRVQVTLPHLRIHSAVVFEGSV